MERDFALQDQVVGIVGVIALLVLAAGLLRRLGKPSKRFVQSDPQAIECEKCGYYLVPSDTQCPKCHAPVTREKISN